MVRGVDIPWVGGSRGGIYTIGRGVKIPGRRVDIP